MITPIESLKEAEENLKDKTFTQEKSPLSHLDLDFAPFNEKSFCQWLDFFNRAGGQILEIGGGPELIAAQEILSRFPNLSLFEIELRTILEAILKKIKSGKFQLINQGFSDVIQNPDFQNQRFHLIFAHNLLSHLPNPFFIIERGYQLLTDGGILFVNDLLIYEEQWEKIVAYLQKYSFSWKIKKTPNNLRKKGIVSVSLTIQRNQPDLIFPVKEGNRLTDFTGQPLGPKEYFFGNN